MSQTTAIQLRATHSSTDSWVPYRYEPSVPAAAIFLVLFLLTTLFHGFQMFRRKSWFFIPLIVGGCFEFGGYAARIVSHNDIYALSPYISQSLLLLLAPALFAASIYIVLGRIIRATHGAQYSLIRPQWLTKIFVIGDVFSFLVQSSGGGIQASGGNSSYKTGEDLIVAGLFLQVLFFGIFIVVAVVFHTRLAKAHRSSLLLPRQEAMVGTSESYKKYLLALYIGSGLIMLRSVFRVVEYLMGNDGYLLRYEVFLYVFDAAPMLAVMVLFNWVHPGGLVDESEVIVDMVEPKSDQRV